MPQWLYPLVGIGLYLGALLYIGVRASRRMEGLRDYFAGGKQMGFWAVAFSARATGESAWLLLGLTGMAAVVGLEALWVVIGELLGLALSWIGMSRPFKRLTDHYDALTIPDYLEARFGDESHALRVTAALALIVFVTIYVSAQIDATGAAFETFLGWNYYTGVIVGFAVVVVYIVSGGFVAVVWSDVFQGLLMVIGLVALPLTALWMAGGVGEVWTGLRASAPELLTMWPSTDGIMAIAEILSLLLIGLGFLGSPQLFVRFIALRSEGELRAGTTVALLWTLLADLGAVAIGLVGRHLLVGGEATVALLGAGGQNVLPRLVEHTMPVFLVGLYIAVVLAAIMSTIDSLLVLAASAIVRDYLQKTRLSVLSEVVLVTYSRIATFGLAAVSLAIALVVAVVTPERTVFWFVIFGWSGITATFCPTILLSLFWSSMTARGAMAAMLTGMVSVPLFKFAAPWLPGAAGLFFETLSELPPSFALSLLAGVAMSLGDRTRQARRQAFRGDWTAASANHQS